MARKITQTIIVGTRGPVECEVTMHACDYCGRGLAERCWVFSPLDDGSAYHKVCRVLCEGCERTYRQAPWGFQAYTFGCPCPEHSN